jgi:RES domain-containing protein
MDWSAWHDRRQKAPAVKRVPLCADGEAYAALEAAQGGLSRFKEIPELQAAVEAATMVITFQAMNADDYRALKDEHKPKDSKANPGAEYGDSFHLALVQRSVVDPPELVDNDAVVELWQALTLVERALLFFAARDLNETLPDLDFIKPGTEPTRGTGQSSTTAPPAA